MDKGQQRPLRVLQVNKAYFPHIGGIETVIRDHAEGLTARGVQVKVLVCQEKGKGTHRVIDGVPVEYASSIGTYFSCPVSFSFLRAFRRLSKWADVIELHAPFPLGDLACLLSGYKGAVVIAWHSDVVRQKKLMRLYKPLLLRYLKRADCVFVATPGHIDSSPILSQFREKCRIIPYGIDVPAYLSVPRTPILSQRQGDKSRVKLLFVGRFVYYKGIEVLLRAFCQVQGCDLFLVGQGTPEMEQKLHQMAKDGGVSDRVYFLGNLSTDALRAAFADCDVFILPSVANSEAFGIVQLEAMVYGKPVINTALATGVPYVSLDGETGLTVPPEDADALAKAIQKLADDPKLREQYGKAAADRVANSFAAKVVLDQVHQALTELAERRREPCGH